MAPTTVASRAFSSSFTSSTRSRGSPVPGLKINIAVTKVQPAPKVVPPSAVQVLGCGAHGSVVRQVCPITGEPIAVKTVSLAADPIAVRAQSRDAKMLAFWATAAHPNVMHMHPAAAHMHAAADTESCVIVMPLADRGDLFSLVESKSLDETLARDVFQGVLRGVAHMHASGFAHGDLSPENVVVRTDSAGNWCPMVTDFGQTFACTASDNFEFTDLADAVGKAAYRAPEIRPHTPFNGQAADMYALGVVLFMMLIGRFPYKSVGDVLYQAIQSRRLAQVLTAWGISFPSLAIELVQELLSENPSARPTAAQALAHAWFTGSDACSVTSELPPPEADSDDDISMC